MADEFVSGAQFGEFVKRIDERFDHVGKEFANVNKVADQRYESINQRMADAEKARDQNLVHVDQRFDDMIRGVNERFDDMNRGMNQRFDSLEKRMDLFHADMLQMRNWLVRLYGLVVFGLISTIALILLKDVIFK